MAPQSERPPLDDHRCSLSAGQGNHGPPEVSGRVFSRKALIQPSSRSCFQIPPPMQRVMNTSQLTRDLCLVPEGKGVVARKLIEGDRLASSEPFDVVRH